MNERKTWALSGVTGLKLGAVHLNAAHLEHTALFYKVKMGLQVEKDVDRILLSAGKEPLIVLHPADHAIRTPRATGLYHLALLMHDRVALSRILVHLIRSGTLDLGAADHGVSEALYLQDAEGNGIELYRDRPRSQWRYDASGNLQMVTDSLDLENLLAASGAEAAGWRPSAATTVGHVHLKVANLNEAVDFYQNILGFKITQRYGQTAAFLSVGEYHHHIGLNTWESLNGPPMPPGSPGLRYFELHTSGGASCDQLSRQLRAAGCAVEEQTAGLLVRDPSGNGILLRQGLTK